MCGILMLTGSAVRAFDIGDVLSPWSAPFILIPEIGIDPDSGTTLGVIPAFLRHDAAGNVDRIIAPDISYSSYFGWGLRGRIFDYPSEDTRWLVIAGAKQRVERKFDAEYETGRTRDETWTFSAAAVYERTGALRFFGIGNETTLSAQSDYTEGDALFQTLVGWNITHAWQLAYVLQARDVDVTAGTLTRLPSITTQYQGLPGLGSNGELLNRLMLTYDSRNDVSIPTRGMRLVVYGSLSSRSGDFNDSLYSEFGIDLRDFVPLASRTVLVLHAALRELPSYHNLPFWAYSMLGGDQSVIGGSEPLRAFTEGRFTDVNSWSASVELRRIVTSFRVTTTQVDLELAPFVDVGQVYPHMSASLLSHPHEAYGVGFRGIARPNVVAYVDIGYGSEGTAAFSGINYIF
jgi:outer membrane protein assembly factor BamA